MTSISFYTNKNQYSGETTVEEITDIIRTGEFPATGNDLRGQIDSIRSSSDGGELKKELPAFTPSGRFDNSHKADKLIEYSGIIVLDFDKIPKNEMDSIKALISKCDYTHLCFISPSGNGLKVLVRVDSDSLRHKEAFKQVASFYDDLAGVKCDRTGSDVSRLCFFSYDPEIYHNPDSSTFEVDGQRIATAIRLTNQKHQFVEGQRNHFIHLLACNCNREGVEKSEAITVIVSKYATTDFGAGEIVKTVESAYKSNEKEFGKNRKSIEAFLRERYTFRYNEVTGHVEMKAHNQSEYSAMSEDYMLNTLWYRATQSGIKISKNQLDDILKSEFSPRFNPFVSYINGLTKWDGHDYIGDLAQTVKTDDDEAFIYVLRKFIVAMVASWMVKKNVNQTMLIFSGKQGIGKSTWFNNLLPSPLREYKFTGSINPKNKDTLYYLSRMAMIDMDELANLTRADAKRVKEIITMPEINMRKAYGKIYEQLPRRASFVGSVNEDKFLSDLSGNRRFLPFVVTHIEYNHSVDLDGVYAQAKALLNSGFKWFFEDKEIAWLNERNERFRQQTYIEDLIRQNFEPVEDKQDADFTGSATDILNYLGRYYKVKGDMTEIIEVGKMMSELGCIKTMSRGVPRYHLKRVNPRANNLEAPAKVVSIKEGDWEKKKAS